MIIGSGQWLFANRMPLPTICMISHPPPLPDLLGQPLLTDYNLIFQFPSHSLLPPHETLSLLSAT